MRLWTFVPFTRVSAQDNAENADNLNDQAQFVVPNDAIVTETDQSSSKTAEKSVDVLNTDLKVDVLAAEYKFEQELNLYDLAVAEYTDRVIFKVRLDYEVDQVKQWIEELDLEISQAEAGRNAAMAKIESCATNQMKSFADLRKNKRVRKSAAPAAEPAASATAAAAGAAGEQAGDGAAV